MTTENPVSNEIPAAGPKTEWPPSMEEEVRVPPDIRLFVRRTHPAEPALGVVVLVHGMGEHSGRYGHLAGALRARGLAVIGWDLRGHGRSGGARGDAADNESLVDDLAAICARFREENRPFFLFGHSLGAQIVLRYLERGAAACQGAVIASPWLRLAFDPPWWKVLLARLAMRVRPAFIQTTPLRAERLSRDAAHLASFPDPDLTHRRISARMFFALQDNGRRVLAAAGSIRTPLLLLHGDDDPVTSHHATCEFFEQTGSADKTLRIFPGARHEMHNDLDRAQVLREIGDWIAARLAPAREV